MTQRRLETRTIHRDQLPQDDPAMAGMIAARQDNHAAAGCTVCQAIIADRAADLPGQPPTAMAEARADAREIMADRPKLGRDLVVDHRLAVRGDQAAHDRIIKRLRARDADARTRDDEPTPTQAATADEQAGTGCTHGRVTDDHCGDDDCPLHLDPPDDPAPQDPNADACACPDAGASCPQHPGCTCSNVADPSCPVHDGTVDLNAYNPCLACADGHLPGPNRRKAAHTCEDFENDEAGPCVICGGPFVVCDRDLAGAVESDLDAPIVQHGTCADSQDIARDEIARLTLVLGRAKDRGFARGQYPVLDALLVIMLDARHGAHLWAVDPAAYGQALTAASKGLARAAGMVDDEDGTYNPAAEHYVRR